MEAVILIGLQASGKSTFCRERFYDSHVRINLDMLRTRHRERLLVEACLRAKQSFVVDNTNPTRRTRERYIRPSLEHGFLVTAYWFDCAFEDCQRRNELRTQRQCVPLVGLLRTRRILEPPQYGEGFGRIYRVTADDSGSFLEQELSSGKVSQQRT